MSYDVISLFTNVLTDLVVEVTKRRLEEDVNILNEIGIEANLLPQSFSSAFHQPTSSTKGNTMSKSMEQLWVPQYPQWWQIS